MSSSESDSSHESDFHILHTRSTSYRTTQQNSQSPSSTASSSSNNQKKTNRLTFLKCTEHDDDNKNTWTSMHSNCRDCTRFTNLLDGLKVNVLPRTVDVLNLLLTTKNGLWHDTKWNGGDVYVECAQLVTLTWLNCNVYPSSLKTVKKRLYDLFEEYGAIKKYSKKSAAYWSKCTHFLQKITELFSIQADTELQT